MGLKACMPNGLDPLTGRRCQRSVSTPRDTGRRPTIHHNIKDPMFAERSPQGGQVIRDFMARHART